MYISVLFFLQSGLPCTAGSAFEVDLQSDAEISAHPLPHEVNWGASNAHCSAPNDMPDEVLEAVAPRKARIQELAHVDDVPKKVELRRHVVAEYTLVLGMMGQPMVLDQEAIGVLHHASVCINRNDLA